MSNSLNIVLGAVIHFFDSIGDCSTARDTVPPFLFLTKLSEARAINETDQPHVLAYERSKFLVRKAAADVFFSLSNINIHNQISVFFEIFQYTLKFRIFVDSPSGNKNAKEPENQKA